MNTPFTYDFGYSWGVTWFPVIPLVLFGGLAVLAYRLGWRRWVLGASGLLAVWSVVALVLLHGVFGINLPMGVPEAGFMASGWGEVVDVGAGSGRASIGLLLARPNVRVTAIDIYDGYYGIEGNTPERFMRNARIAGVADRARAEVGDARAIPLPDAAYDGVISTYAIDHLRRAEIPGALSEVNRILKPGGDFLLAVVKVDWWLSLISPPLAHHARANPEHWREMLGTAGFEILEQGAAPASLHFLARKPAASPASTPPQAGR